MAKSMLLHILADVLGKYVEGLTRENLKLGVWSGRIELFNLRLKSTALDDLNLPIKVEKGSLRTLKVKIPWAHLESKPVVIEMDGIILQAAPLDLHSIKTEDLQRLIHSDKTKRLQQIEQAVLDAVLRNEDIQTKAKKATYVQQLTTKIIDNLELTLTNIHIRYEDSVSVPNNPFACGMTIERISLATTDESWTPGFVTRDAANKANTSVHKLGTMEGLGIYWNSADCQLSQCKNFEEWVAYMLAMIPYAASGVSADAALVLEPMKHILSPRNSFEMKLVHKEQSREDSPNLDLSMSSTTLPFLITDVQFIQLRMLLKEFGSIKLRKMMMSYRPSRRPTEAPREWWKYAYQLVTGRDCSTFNKMERLVMNLKARKVYLPYWKKRIMLREVLGVDLADSSSLEGTVTSTSGGGGGGNGSGGDNDTPSHITNIEDTVPIASLILFRQAAAREAAKEVQRLNSDPKLMEEFKTIHKSLLAQHLAAASKHSVASGDSWHFRRRGSATVASADGTGKGTSTAHGKLFPVKDKSKPGFFSRMLHRKKKGDGVPVAKPSEDGAGGTDGKGGPSPREGAVVGGSDTDTTFSDSASEIDEDDLALMDSIEARIQEYSDEAEATAVSAGFALRARIATSASLDVCLGSTNLINVVMATKACAEIRSGNNVCVVFELDNISVSDSVTPNPFTPYLVSSVVSTDASISVGLDALRIPVLSFNNLGAIEDKDRATQSGAQHQHHRNHPHHRHHRPQFSACFETKSGRNSLRAAAIPLQVTCNELCVQKLLQFVTAPLPLDENSFHALIKNSPLLAEKMSKFSSEMALPTGYTDIELEIFAPKFIIPEQMSVDAGCLLLDTGKLLMKGEIGPLGMKWNIELQDVHMDMPAQMSLTHRETPVLVATTASTLGHTSSLTSSTAYLVKPFTLEVSVELKNGIETGAAISMALLPLLEARLDAKKIIRLKYLLDVLQRAVRRSNTSTSATASTSILSRVSRQNATRLTGAPVASSSSVVGSAADGPSLAEYKPGDEELLEVNPMRKLLVLTAHIPAVKLCLQLQDSGHTLELTYSLIHVHHIKRAFDSNLFLKVNSVSLSDSMRPEKHRLIAWTMLDADDDNYKDSASMKKCEIKQEEATSKRVAHSGTGGDCSDARRQLVSVHFRSVSSPLSPLFDGNKIELSIVCAGVGCSIDERATLRYSPFLADLLAQFNEYKQLNRRLRGKNPDIVLVPLQEQNGTDADHSSVHLTSSIEAAPKPRALAAGLKIVFSFAELSLNLLQEVPPPHDFATGVSPAAATMATTTAPASEMSSSSSTTDEVYYEEAFNIDVSDMFARFEMAAREGQGQSSARPGHAAKAMEAHVRAFEITDRRSSSRENFYTTLVCKRTAPVGIDEDEDPASSTASATAGTAGAARRRTSSMGSVNTSISGAQVSRNLLTLSLEQLQDDAMSADIKLFDVSTFVSLDVAKALVKLLLSNVTALATVMKTLRDDASVRKLAQRGQHHVKTYIARRKQQYQQQYGSARGGEGASEGGRASLSSKKPDIEDEDDVDPQYGAQKPQRFIIGIHIERPQLLFLADPANEGTQAVVGDCSIRCNLVREVIPCVDTSLNRGPSVRDVLHVALQDAEVFVCTDMKHATAVPHKIVEPAMLELHFKRSTENGVTLSNTFMLLGSIVRTRVSLNDIILVKSILSRAQLTSGFNESDRGPLGASKFTRTHHQNDLSSAATSTAAAGAATGTAAGVKAGTGGSSMETSEKRVTIVTKDTASEIMQSVCVNDIRGSFSEISFVLLNDFNNQNIPIAQLKVEAIEVSVTGPSQNMSGEGCFAASADYYNSRVTAWEPVLEKWQPSLVLQKDFNGTLLTLSTEQTLQLNVTGAFLRGLHTATALVDKIGKAGSYGTHRAIHPLVVQNRLGLPIRLVDSNTKQLLLLLGANDGVVDVPPVRCGKDKSLQVFPTLFDLHLTDDLAEERQPILQVPSTACKPKSFSFQPSGRILAKMASSRLTSGEPIVEEVYENSRFNTFSMTWGEPWASMGDPSVWTDSRGVRVSEPNRFQLPLNWHWVEPAWRVDKSGVVGVAVDEEGWEYASKFSSFAAGRKKRVQKGLDPVRRRRLVRTRAPNTGGGGAGSMSVGGVGTRGLPIIWSVQTMPDESKHIEISSGVYVRNELPFALELDLIDMGAENSASEHFTLASSEIFGVPLSHATRSFARIRPKRASICSWSEAFRCQLKTSESDTLLTEVHRVKCFDEKEQHHVYMTVHVQYKDRVLTISCSACAEVFNWLPCSLSVWCVSGVHIRDTVVMKPGALGKVTRANMLSSTATIALSTYEYSSSIPIRLDPSNGEGKVECERTILLPHKSSSTGVSATEAHGGGDASPMHRGPSSSDQICLTMKTTFSPETGALQIYIFSSYLLVDHSDCALVVRSAVGAGNSILTFSPSEKQEVIKRRCSITSRDGTVKNATPISDDLNKLDDSQFDSCWVTGRCGVTLFQSGSNGIVSLGINGGRGWLGELSLSSLSSKRTPIEIVDEKTQKGYQLALSLSPFSTNLECTQVLTVVPSIMIVNYMDEEIDLLHPTNTAWDLGKMSTIAPKSSSPWHRPASFPSSTVRIKCESSLGSLGVVDLNEIGTTTMILPSNHANATTAGGADLIVVQIDVSLSGPEACSYITVVVWRSCLSRRPNGLIDASTSALSVKNKTDLPLVIQQEGLHQVFSRQGSAYQKKFTLCIPPGEWLPYGWADPCIGSSVRVAVGTNSDFLPGEFVVIDTLNLAKTCNVPVPHLPQYANKIKLSVEAEGSGLVLRIHLTQNSAPLSGVSTAGENAAAAAAVENEHGLDVTDLRRRDFQFVMMLPTIGVSLIAERPTRREFFSLYIDRFEASVLKISESQLEDAQLSVEVKAMDMQVDNYSETAVYPVLVNTYHGDDRKRLALQRRRSKLSGQSGGTSSIHGGGDRGGAALVPQNSRRSSSNSISGDSPSDSAAEMPQFFNVALVQDTPRGHSTSIIKYFALRFLELSIAVDSSTILLFFCDFYGDLVNKTNASDSSGNNSAVEVGMSEANAHTLSELRRLYQTALGRIDPAVSFQRALQQKVFFEAFLIHPIKLTITYTVTTFPRNLREELQHVQGHGWLSSLQHISNMEGLEVHINSFIVNHALESRRSLLDRVREKTKRELQNRLIQLAGSVFGSMNALGKPVGLYKKLGNGVQDFFYEPYMGMMESPQAFVQGIGIGTGSLVSGVASGLISSTASIVGTATSGVSSVAKGVISLSGDEEYMRKRDERRREQRASQGGVLAGMKAGGESILGGVTSGITGLVTNPYQQGKKDGALGFFKGVGMGLVGVAVKPVLGVADGITSVATGLTQQAADAAISVSRARHARTFGRSAHDPSALVLSPIDLFACEAQHYVLRRATRRGYKDQFVASVSLGFMRSSLPRQDAAYGVVISESYVFLLNKAFEPIWESALSDISHVVFKGDKYRASVEFVLYQSGGATERREVACATRSHGLHLYSELAKLAGQMGNPAAVVDPDKLPFVTNAAPAELQQSGGEQLPRSSSISNNLLSSFKIPGWSVEDFMTVGSADRAASAVSGKPGAALGCKEVGEYVFGSANGVELPHESRSSAEVIDRATQSLQGVPFSAIIAHGSGEDGGLVAAGDLVLPRDEYHQLMDELVWELVLDWRNNHNIVLNPSRCSAVLIINNSSTFVQILETELQEGAGVVTLGVGKGYDADSRTLLNNGGAAVVFAYGHTPTLLDLAHVKIKLFTSAFEAMVSTRKTKTKCKNNGNYQTALREVSRTDFWAKTTLVIDC